MPLRGMAITDKSGTLVTASAVSSIVNRSGRLIVGAQTFFWAPTPRGVGDGGFGHYAMASGVLTREYCAE